ncbi:hypothetical protein KY285_030296 [Solanum tuberosum]|nr:hypothetical protein KY285_030296 [Solanum tuberosum]
MAHLPPAELVRPPDIAPRIQKNKTEQTQQISVSQSSHNSPNERRIEEVNTVISEWELDWARKIISMAQSGSIRDRRDGENESQSQSPPNTKKSKDSTVPFERNQVAISGRNLGESPQSRFQIRSSSDEIRAEDPIGEYSPVLVEHRTEISSNINGEIIGNEVSGNLTGSPANNENKEQREEELQENTSRNGQQRSVEHHPSKLIVEKGGNSAKMHARGTDEIQVDRTGVEQVHKKNKEIELKTQTIGGEEMRLQNQVIEVSNSTNFSFGDKTKEQDHKINSQHEQHTNQRGQSKEKNQYLQSKTNADQNQPEQGNGEEKDQQQQ